MSAYSSASRGERSTGDVTREIPEYECGYNITNGEDPMMQARMKNPALIVPDTLKHR